MTDVNGLYGTVRFRKACREHGVAAIVGTELQVAGDRLLLLARSRDGYGRLCRIVTELAQRGVFRRTIDPPMEAEERREAAALLRDLLEEHRTDVVAICGSRGSRIDRALATGDRRRAEIEVGILRDIFADHLYLELSHQAIEGDNRRLARALRFASLAAIPTVATNDVRYAVAEDYRRYDLLGCIDRLSSIFEPHAMRPRNAEAWLKPRELLYPALIPREGAFERADEIAQDCRWDLLPDRVIPPKARLPEGINPRRRLAELCREGLEQRVVPKGRDRALAQLEKELGIIGHLDLEEYFLVVHEVVEESRRRDIRCAGRGSAANSLVAYLLGITHVDPIEQGLLFERLLHTGRKGTPDIDVDFDSERRGEIIEWVEERFGIEQTAMTAAVITYGLRSAVRDVGKAYGWDLETINEMIKELSPRSPRLIADYEGVIRRHLGETPLVDSFMASVASLQDCPRHLGLHSGGMLFTREPLWHYTPVQVSANGVRVAQFDKDDVEALGLIKFDILGLRMLATISEAREIIALQKGEKIDFDRLPLDDAGVFELIRSGRTLGLFQIESQGQMHLLAQTQPEDFFDLIVQVALFRPGPLQGDMVHPYTRRRRGREEVTYMHPDLALILKDTFGLILFQEQILEIAHHFAGMSLADADDFRKAISKDRDADRMEALRDRFVDGACARGVDEASAVAVFEKVSHFVGYGFCRSHAAAFAQTVYISAWLKCYHPDAYFAAFMQHRPGMYAQLTLEEEAQRFGVRTFLPDIEHSGARFRLEKREGTWGIRTPLTRIKGITTDDVQAILLERARENFASIEDFYRRVSLDTDAFDALARAGAFDRLAGDARRALWEVGVIQGRLKQPGQVAEPSLFSLPTLMTEDMPELPILTIAERLTWDYRTFGSARVHPMTLARRELNDWEVRTIETCYRMTIAGRPRILVAGNVVLRQMPPTAKGFMFLMLEDETGYIQVIVPPKTVERFSSLLAKPALIIRAEIEATGAWRGLLLRDVWELERVIGGYQGMASAAGRTGRPVEERMQNGEQRMKNAE